MSIVDPRLWLSLALLSLGCDALKGDDPPAKAHKKAEPEPETPPDVGPVELPPLALERAEHRLRFGAKGAERMGFALPKLSNLYALAGAIELPDWSEPGEGAARLTRDDDLRTAWICDPGPEQTCAIGIHFPVAAEVEVVRVYAADPGGKKAFSRPTRVRVHTTEGRADAIFSSDDHHWHVVLGEPVSTRNLTLEILETDGEGPVHLAELEVYGRSGAERSPLEIDMSRRLVTFTQGPWRSKARTHDSRHGFIEQVDVDGRLRRLLRGTALIGRQGDRIVLLEHADWTTCEDHAGTYDLVDLQTRVVVPLGDLGGFGATLFRHAKGRGVAAGTLDEDDGAVRGAVLDGEQYEHRISNRLDRRSPRELLEDWGFDATPMSRSDARSLDDPPAGCQPATAELLDRLRPHLPKRAKIVPEQWHACTLGNDARALMTTGGPCGTEWHVAALDGEGELLGLRSGKESGTHLRLRRVDRETLLVELWGSKDTPVVLRVDEDGPSEVARDAGLALRPPSACRKRCDQGFDDLRDGKR